MRGSLDYLETRPVDPETGETVPDQWLQDRGWKVLWSGGLGDLLHGAPGAAPIEGAVTLISAGQDGWRWIKAELEQNIRDAWPDLPQRVKDRLKTLGSVDAVADKLRKMLLDCTWEEDDGEGNTVVRRARVSQLPQGETSTATNLPPHYWSGDEN